MNPSHLCPNKGLSIGLITRAALLTVTIAMLGSGYLRSQTVATYDFEDGTAEGWGSFYGASTPVATNAAAYTGSYSLLTTTASAGHGGPSISLNSVLLPGAHIHDYRMGQAGLRRHQRQCELLDGPGRFERHQL